MPDKLSLHVKTSFKRFRGKYVISPIAMGSEIVVGPDECPVTVLIAIRDPVNIPRAGSTIRLGYLRAFGKLGIRAKLVRSFDLEKEIKTNKNPLLFLSLFDYLDFGANLRGEIRRLPHGVWIAPNAAVYREAYDRLNFQIPPNDPIAEKYAGDSNATFYWAPAPPSFIETAYSDWRKFGPVASLPLACDDTCYFPSVTGSASEAPSMVFCGGYWIQKSLQFETYLRPYEDELAVFGRDPWPYKGYGGAISFESERRLYQAAKVCPALSEPHVELTGDIVERAFKVLGCGGLALPDVAPGYGELFSEEELLMPRTVKQYHELMQLALNDPDANERYRTRGHAAVMSRHLYIHRAARMMELFGHGALVPGDCSRT
jgi:hypothetical protein